MTKKTDNGWPSKYKYLFDYGLNLKLFNYKNFSK